MRGDDETHFRHDEIRHIYTTYRTLIFATRINHNPIATLCKNLGEQAPALLMELAKLSVEKIYAGMER